MGRAGSCRSWAKPLRTGEKPGQIEVLQPTSWLEKLSDWLEMYHFFDPAITWNRVTVVLCCEIMAIIYCKESSITIY